MMKKIFLFTMLALLSLLVITGCGGSNKANKSSEGDGEYTIRIGTSNPPEHPMSRSMEKFKELVEEKSEGRIKVNTFPNSQLGNQTEMNEGTKNGTITASYSGMSYIAGNFEPNFNTLSLPFLITRDNLDKAFELLDGEIGAELTEYLERSGITALGYSNIGFRHLTNSVREIRSPEDLQGIKIRLQPNKIHIDTFNELGASPVALDFAEVYTGLQQKVIDAQENPFDIIATSNFHEVQDYLTLTGHFFDFAAIWFNKEYFDNLPADLQDVLMEAGKETAVFHRQLYLDEEESYLNQLKEAGMQVYEPTPEEIQRFQEVAKPVYEKYLNEAEDRDLAERILKELGVELQ
ncbi:TRAP transporter substrate-binding protein [bacterium LRH843]|nr:TRAP transporter substrate-binding protein [bacterium LRH843]